jgi:MATE family multidrug resistance protein
MGTWHFSMMVDRQKCKELLILAWPLIIANGFWNLQLTIDRIYLGAFSTEALGASMAVMSIFWTPMALLQQTGSYVTTFVAQYLGSKNEEMVGPALWQSMYLSAFGGALFLLFILVSEPFFKFIGHSPAVQLLEIEYFNAICFSALPMALVASLSGYFTGITKTQMVMWVNGVGLITNVILDYLLIFGNLGFKAYGVAGAGYATVLANFASVFFALGVILFSKESVRFKIKSSYKINKNLMYRYLKYGLPSGLQWSLEGLAFTVFLILVGRFANGEAALASSSIAVTVMMLSVMPAIGVAQSVMVKVGHHLGENDPESARSYTWAGAQLSAVYMCTAGLSFFIFPEFYMNWFKNESNPVLWGQVTQIAPVLLMLVGVFTTFDSMYLNLSFALKGAGDTRFVSLVALFMPWPIMVIPTYFLTDNPKAVYLAWGFATLYIMLTALIILLRFNGGKWMKMSVID